MELQQWITYLGYALWQWSASLNYTHFIAIGAAYAVGYRTANKRGKDE